MVIRGLEFRDMETFIQATNLWATTMPQAVLKQCVEEAVSFLNELAAGQNTNREAMASALYNRSSTLLDDWGVYKNTPFFKRVWGDVEQDANNKQYNDAKRENARNRVRNNWKDDGEQFLAFNNAIQWSVKTAKLSKMVPDYKQAMRFLNRALYQRRAGAEPGVPCDLTPRNLDLERAIDLARTASGNSIAPLSEAELGFGGEAFQLYIGNGGILSYEPPSFQGSVQEVCGQLSDFNKSNFLVVFTD